MEKRIPHCKLSAVKNFVQSNQIRVTKTARTGATALGLSYTDMLNVVLNLKQSDFFKSMTTHVDHKVWQDVYRPTLPGGARVYLKLTVIDDLLIVSFKER